FEKFASVHAKRIRLVNSAFNVTIINCSRYFIGLEPVSQRRRQHRSVFDESLGDLLLFHQNKLALQSPHLSQFAPRDQYISQTLKNGSQPQYGYTRSLVLIGGNAMSLRFS